ncbi:MAG: S41 family peptidase, partial [Syntrophothermus sp.]
LFSESVKDADKKQDETVKIDAEGLLKRTYPLPVPAGNYFYLKAGKGKVAWSSVPKFTEAEYEEIFKPGNETKWDLHIFDIAKKSEVVLSEKIRDFNLSANQENIIIQKGQDFYTTSLEKAFQSKSLGDKLDLSRMSYQVDNLKEWNQIFSDTWRWYRDFFYDKNMHGRDWKAVGEKYRSYIPQLTSREDLNWVMQQLVGELCVSHTYVGGGDMGPSAVPNTPSPVFSGWLGADLKADKKTGYYIFDKIYGPDEYNLNLKSPLSRPDITLKEGDYLIAINGKEVKVPEDYFALLQVSLGQKVSVTVSSTPKSEGARTYEVEPVRNDQSLRYFRWISDNIKKVLAASNGKLGYMHINAMNSAGIAEFDKYWRAFRYKEGILIDVRRNSGGWTEYFMIDKLERKMTAYNCLTGMEPFRYPGSTSTAKFAAISNEYNGSDGEAFIEDFKANKLGKVVGVPSWGGLVGIINNQKTIDNGSVDQSNNAFFGKEGNWLVENHGADPDVLIDNDPQSVMAGRDPQLEKAIEVVLEQINKEPFRFSERPAYPVR